jgi:osmoprotectant transport system permease protein
LAVSRRTLLLASPVILSVVFATGCGSGAPPLVVGSAAAPDRMIIAEIASQVLEKHLNASVTRRFDMGSTQIAYEALMLNNISVLPEETNAVLVSLLKEPIDPNPDIAFERVRAEMERVARIQVLKPLGVRPRNVMVIRAADQKAGGIETLSQAALSKLSWTIGYAADFESRADGFASLMGTYKLPLSVAPKSMPAAALYPALADNQVSIIAGEDIDGPLEGSNFAILKDDKGAFRESRTCLLIGPEAATRNPKVRPALELLSGKFTNDAIRKLGYQVAMLRKPLKDVASDFLRQAGL